MDYKKPRSAADSSINLRNQQLLPEVKAPSLGKGLSNFELVRESVETNLAD